MFRRDPTRPRARPADIQTVPDTATPIADQRPIPRWPATLLLAHVARLITLKVERGLEPEMLWISHVALAIAAAGFLLRSASLLSVVFVSIAALPTGLTIDAGIAR